MKVGSVVTFELLALGLEKLTATYFQANAE